MAIETYFAFVWRRNVRKKWIKLSEQDMKAQLEAARRLYGSDVNSDSKKEFKSRHGAMIGKNDHLEKEFKKDFQNGTPNRPKST